MDIQEIRRARLKQLIAEQYEGSQSLFIDRTGENQGEISALLRTKSFGEKKARKLEQKCGLPAGWLDVRATSEGPTAPAVSDDEQQRLPQLSIVKNSEPQWMALVYVSQDELNLLTNYRRATAVGRAVIETAGETAAKEASGAPSGLNQQ